MSSSSNVILQAKDLTKQVSLPDGELTILKNVSFSISEGESIAVVGVSGSGKSTLLGLLAGLDVPSKGSVQLDGVDLGSLDEDGRARLRNQRIGFVFQSFQLLPGLTAIENVMLPLELGGVDKPDEIAGGILAEVGLSERLHHYPNQLSGGEQQRVAIARAFTGEPRILFADEPTGNLDQVTAQQIVELIFRLNSERGTTLVLVTHDHDLAAHCDRQITLAGGELVQQQ